MSDQTNPPQLGDPTYTDLVRRDFDRLAAFDVEDWNHNNHYHDFLLSHLPSHLSSALDVGCGTGSFARRLAARTSHVLGIDLSPAMIKLAQERSRNYPNVTYQVADVMAANLPSAGLPPASFYHESPTHIVGGAELFRAGAGGPVTRRAGFDCIASIATLHHLPLVETLARLRDLLRPGGTLLVLDLYQPATPADYLIAAAAIPVHRWLDWRKNAGRVAPQDHADAGAANAAWDEHGSHDVYPTLAEVRRACAAVLPQAQVRRHLLWRYSLVWTKIGHTSD